MITLITGKQASGKTTKAKKITINTRTEWLSEYSIKSPFWTSCIKKNINTIVIDEVKNKSTVKMFLSGDKLEINKRCGKPYEIAMPNIILISQSLKGSNFKNKKLNVIECSTL